MYPRAPLRLLPAALFVSACAADPLTPAGARVAVVSVAPAGCALVSALRGSAGYNGRSGEANAAAVETYLRNTAAAKGGDTVVVTSRQLGAGGDGDTLSQPRGASVSGGCPNCVAVTANAYRCGGPHAAPAAPTPAPPPAAAPEGDPPFSEKAAAAALAAAAESARACRDRGGPTGEARVRVTFAPTGDVVYSEVADAPIAGSAAGECVARKFRNARVPPFRGEARTLGAAVRLGD